MPEKIRFEMSPNDAMAAMHALIAERERLAKYKNVTNYGPLTLEERDRLIERLGYVIPK